MKPVTGGNTLQHLGPGNFAMVMGLSGLALAWRRAQEAMGEIAAAVGLVLAVLAALAFVALAAASLWRWQRHRQAWAEDLRHPVRHAFVAAIPISWILLVTLAHGLFGALPGLAAAWLLGCTAQGLVTLWVLARWLRGPAVGWPAVTPVLFIPVVGNVLAPLAGVGLGFEAWSAAQFGIGLLLWPVVLALLFVRLVAQGAWPERLLATGFITVAPPAVAGLAALQFRAAPLLAWMAWGVALGFALWAASALPRLQAQPFALPMWAMSFPLAALATLTLRLGATPLGIALLALASLVVLGLLLGTWRAWREGRLWVSEPVAALHPVAPAT